MITAKEAFAKSSENAKPEYEELVKSFELLQKVAIDSGHSKLYFITKGSGDFARNKFKCELEALGYTFGGWLQMQSGKDMYDAMIHWGS